MKKFHQIISMLLVLILTVSCLPLPVQAAQNKTIQIEYHYENPIYHANVQPAPYTDARADMADPAAISAAASQLKEAIKSRQAECIVEIRTDSYEEEGFKAMLHAIAAEAETHTGVPTEGDYIMWQYGGWNASASGSQSSSGEYVWTISYLYEYYTTAQEESQVDSKVHEVLNSLNVGAASDYEKVKAIYDYICDNVTYDHDHLNDSSYKHQFTAYAALVQGTSVCQGYALLFYRLALELGVDARLIAGKSRNEGHGWNIVELDNLYYNADTTWDAGNSTYTYFLKCPSNFPDHTRDAEYSTSEFNKAYPMASSDYQPNTETECSHNYETVTTNPTCTADGQTVYTCSKCGDSYTEIIKKLDHDYQSVVTEPTCTAGGYTTHTCSRCLDSYTNNETAPLEHSWDQGVVTLEPTATEAGIRTYTCANCKETKTETIPATGTGECSHSYETVTTDPTCTAEGQTVYTCSLCGDSYTEVIAKLPHQWDEGTVTKEPTATEAGEKTQHCATCDNVRITKIPATGKILRVQGENRYETAFKAADLVKVKLGAEKFNCIVVASGTNFADALPGSYLASQNQAPILLVNKHTVQDVADYIFKNTYSGAVVYILGGEAAVPAALDNLLKEEFTVRRLAGANRYETNLLILEEAGVATEDVLVCTGRDFADSLSVSALRRPILLVNKTLSDSQKTWLQKMESNTIYVVGGTNAVSEAIEKDLANYSYGYVERISGSNRYETSVKVAETFFPLGADNLVLAYGQNFPDGLCGGVLAYNMNAPLILTRDKNASLAAEFALSKEIVTGAVLGGPGLISDKAVQQIFGSDPMLYE